MRSSSWLGPHERKIILHCLIVTIPMLASSLVLLWIVYMNLVTGNCSTEELCPGSDIINVTSGNIYYIDVPTARLAFISSASSTVSLALVAFLMAMYTYVNAGSLLRASKTAKHESLLDPYQMSILLQVLNAELMVLWDMGWSKTKRIFWKSERAEDSSRRSPRILEHGVMALMAGILASLLIQAANVYFHIAAEAVELVQVQELLPTTYEFSRGLAPWCLNRPNMGDLGTRNFWGCSITARLAMNNNATSISPTNATTIQDMKNGVSDQHTAINFTDSDGVQFSIVGPANVETSMDWKASTFGVSTTCSAIPQDGCDVAEPIMNAKDGRGQPVMLVPFSCTKSKAGINIRGTLTAFITATHMMNFHKYATESTPFFNNTMLEPGDMKTAISNISQGEDPNTIFKNGWDVLVMRKIPSAIMGDYSQLPASFLTDARIWKNKILGALVLLNCKVTVWDMTYISAGSKIKVLSKTPSNGSMAGMSSMPGARFVGTLTNIFQDESTGPFARSSPDNFIRSFELGLSKGYSYPLASQLSSRPSILAQSRSSKVVTKLPVAALWFLLATNIAYALLGFGMAWWAVLECTEEVQQVQVRLGVAGFVAAMFNRRRFETAAESEKDLFRVKALRGTSPKKIAVVKTKDGGSSFKLC